MQDKLTRLLQKNIICIDHVNYSNFQAALTLYNFDSSSCLTDTRHLNNAKESLPNTSIVKPKLKSS